MVRTRVGYAGGATKNPTYHQLGDHTETIQIDYDPAQISYQELLDVFWDSHNPTGPAGSRQYMSVVFFHNDEQKRLAIETRGREAARINGQIYTEIVPATEFYLAEAYHQKHQLRQAPDLIREFEIIYPATDDFIDSTAAARVNGYLGGYGTFADLETEMGDLGLSPAGSEKLLNMVYVLKH